MRKGANVENLSHSLTDLTISLMVIFVLLLVVYLNNTSHAAQDAREKILDRLKIQLASIAGLQVKKDPKDPLALLVIVPEELLHFGLNEKEVPMQGRAFLAHFTPRFAAVICSNNFRREIDSVIVEGHTDSTQFRGLSRIKSDSMNLSLSQGRSMSVVASNLDLLKSDKPEYDCFLTLLSASGRGQRDPVIRNGKEDLAASRRVEFRVRVRSTDQRLLKKDVESTVRPSESQQ